METPAPNTKLTNKIYGIAALISLFVTFFFPITYLVLNYQFERNESLISAKLHGAFIAQFIHSNPKDWKNDVQELIDEELAPSDLPEVRSIIDKNLQAITKNKTELAKPLITISTELYDDSGNLIGYIQISRSAFPLLIKTGWVALGGLGLGFTIFLTLYLLPVRALRDALNNLHSEKQKALETANRLKVIIDNATDGIVTLDNQGKIATFSNAAERIFGYTSQEMFGKDIGLLLPHHSSNDEKGFFSPASSIGNWETSGKHKQGNEFPVDVALSEAPTSSAMQYVCIIRDITERKKAEALLNKLANFDSLTGLPNRNLFRDRLDQALIRATRNETLLALMFLDLDRFKTINDTLGHNVGDQLLQQVAGKLSAILRKTDTVSRLSPEFCTSTISRLGGDEFTIILEGLKHVDGVSIVAQKIIDAFIDPFTIEEHELYVTSSIGISMYPFEDTDADGLIKDADTAMYRAKELGKNTYQFFVKDLQNLASNRLTIETNLRQALERNEFSLVYQPQIDLITGKLKGAEVLLRWIQPGENIVSPAEFIPVLEDTGLIIPVGNWVLKTACEQAKKWQDSGIQPFKIAINLSARQFAQKNLVTSVLSILKETQLEPQYLELELTESQLMQHTEYNIATLSNLAKHHISLSLDDFGTGYSSLSYLKRFSIDTLKIDQSFVREITTNQEDKAIASAIIALGKSLSLNVIAEGVETQEQLELLKLLGCNEAQGYLLGRPMSAEALIRHIHDHSLLNV